MNRFLCANFFMHRCIYLHLQVASMGVEPQQRCIISLLALILVYKLKMLSLGLFSLFLGINHSNLTLNQNIFSLRSLNLIFIQVVNILKFLCSFLYILCTLKKVLQFFKHRIHIYLEHTQHFSSHEQVFTFFHS